MTIKLLILGGTTEASALARVIAGWPEMSAVLSLAGRTKRPARAAVPMRIGGFGGGEGLAAYLIGQGVTALIDATHPFARRMSFNAAEAAARAGVPLLALRRLAWVPLPGDRWCEVADVAAAAEALGAKPRRVFLTIGQQELEPFKNMPQHDYLIRSVDPPAPASLPPKATVIAACGPFAETDERCLLEKHKIQVIVTKNSGGDATYGKLAAARTLTLPVIMTTRPPVPAVPTVATVEAAVAWLAGEQRRI